MPIGMETPTKEPEMIIALSALDNSIQNLEEQIEFFAKRIDPILAPPIPVNPKSEKDAVSTPTNHSMVVSRLWSCIKRIDHNREILGILMEQLEI